MKYVFFMGVYLFTLGYSAQSDGPQSGSAQIDECVPIVTSQDIQVFNNLVKAPTDYLSGASELNKEQKEAFKHLVEQANRCKSTITPYTSQPDTLLQIMEANALRNEIPLEDVVALRNIEAQAFGLSPEEQAQLKAIAFPPVEDGRLSEKTVPLLTLASFIDQQGWLLLKKYIELSKSPGGLSGFMISERVSILRVVGSNLGNGFSPEDLAFLRIAELRSNGFSDQQIQNLLSLADRTNSLTPLTPKDVSLLKNWIQIQNLPFNSSLLDFADISKLYELVENSTNPPFSQKDLRMNRIAFQRQLENAPGVDPKFLRALEEVAENVSGFLGASEKLSFEQVKACEQFLNFIIQFGRLPGFSPIQVGATLQLIELLPQFQNLMYPLKTVRYIELIKSGFTYPEKSGLDRIRERHLYQAQEKLSEAESALLKRYIAFARQPGGVNGFGVSYRLDILTVVENHLSGGRLGFTWSDLEILRRVEQSNNGFSPQEIYMFKVLAKDPNQKISMEQFALIERFNQIEKIVGGGILIDPKDSQHLILMAREYQQSIMPRNSGYRGVQSSPEIRSGQQPHPHAPNSFDTNRFQSGPLIDRN